jgi:dUTP pyrophosphatase
MLINHSKVNFEIERGMRIAQMVIAPVVQFNLIKAETLDETKRGAGGFGSTGISAEDECK